MDLRITGRHEKALTQLADAYGQPTATGMVRILIQSAAQKAGMWTNDSADADPESETEETQRDE